MNGVPTAWIFFDIDGTLIDLRGAGRQAFIRSLDHVFQWCDDINYINFAGATDLDVLRRIFKRNGRELTARDVEKFFSRLPVELETTVKEVRPNIFPGVTGLLNALTARGDILMGVITGNIESCARIKLREAGTLHHFLLGAFGHEHADRRQIARLALRRARDLLPAGCGDPPSYLIGDTPSDILAAHDIGAKAMAVATGRFSATELMAAGADTVWENLSDLSRILTDLHLDKPNSDITTLTFPRPSQM